MINNIDWQKVNGLLPCIVQDEMSKDVLMLGYMNPISLTKTIRTKKLCFYSRTRKTLWTKGETSGNHLHLQSLRLDCDGDTLLIKTRSDGPSCHTGSVSCFGEGAPDDLNFLNDLTRIIEDRALAMPEQSYVANLIKQGIHRIAQKIGEEGVEVALAAKDSDTEALLGEMADLMFHLMILLRAKEAHLGDVVAVLKRRHKKTMRRLTRPLC